MESHPQRKDRTTRAEEGREVKVEGRKVVKLGLAERDLERLVRVKEQEGTKTLTDALVRLLDLYEE